MSTNLAPSAQPVPLALVRPAVGTGPTTPEEQVVALPDSSASISSNDGQWLSAGIFKDLPVDQSLVQAAQQYVLRASAVTQQRVAGACGWVKDCYVRNFKIYLERILIGCDLASELPENTVASTLRTVLQQGGERDAAEVNQQVDWLLRPKQDCQVIVDVSGGTRWILSLINDPGRCKRAHLVALGELHGHSEHLIKRLCDAFGCPDGGAAFFAKIDECIRAFPAANKFKQAMLELADKHEAPTSVVTVPAACTSSSSLASAAIASAPAAAASSVVAASGQHDHVSVSLESTVTTVSETKKKKPQKKDKQQAAASVNSDEDEDETMPSSSEDESEDESEEEDAEDAEGEDEDDDEYVPETKKQKKKLPRGSKSNKAKSLESTAVVRVAGARTSKKNADSDAGLQSLEDLLAIIFANKFGGQVRIRPDQTSSSPSFIAPLLSGYSDKAVQAILVQLLDSMRDILSAESLYRQELERLLDLLTEPYLVLKDRVAAGGGGSIDEDTMSASDLSLGAKWEEQEEYEEKKESDKTDETRHKNSRKRVRSLMDSPSPAVKHETDGAGSTSAASVVTASPARKAKRARRRIKEQPEDEGEGTAESSPDAESSSPAAAAAAATTATAAAAAATTATAMEDVAESAAATVAHDLADATSASSTMDVSPAAGPRSGSSSGSDGDDNNTSAASVVTATSPLRSTTSAAKVSTPAPSAKPTPMDVDADDAGASPVKPTTEKDEEEEKSSVPPAVAQPFVEQPPAAAAAAVAPHSSVREAEAAPIDGERTGASEADQVDGAATETDDDDDDASGSRRKRASASKSGASSRSAKPLTKLEKMFPDEHESISNGQKPLPVQFLQAALGEVKNASGADPLIQALRVHQIGEHVYLSGWVGAHAQLLAPFEELPVDEHSLFVLSPGVAPEDAMKDEELHQSLLHQHGGGASRFVYFITCPAKHQTDVIRAGNMILMWMHSLAWCRQLADIDLVDILAQRCATRGVLLRQFNTGKCKAVKKCSERPVVPFEVAWIGAPGTSTAIVGSASGHLGSRAVELMPDLSALCTLAQLRSDIFRHGPVLWACLVNRLHALMSSMPASASESRPVDRVKEITSIAFELVLLSPPSPPPSSSSEGQAALVEVLEWLSKHWNICVSAPFPKKPLVAARYVHGLLLLAHRINTPTTISAIIHLVRKIEGDLIEINDKTHNEPCMLLKSLDKYKDHPSIWSVALRLQDAPSPVAMVQLSETISEIPHLGMKTAFDEYIQRLYGDTTATAAAAAAAAAAATIAPGDNAVKRRGRPLRRAANHHAL